MKYNVGDEGILRLGPGGDTVCIPIEYFDRPCQIIRILNRSYPGYEIQMSGSGDCWMIREANFEPQKGPW